MRPVLRWGFRLFKRDWRQQTLVIALLTFAVAAALFLSVAISNAIESPAGEFGRANVLIQQRASDGPRAAANLDALRQRFGGVVEVVGHRRISIPGSADVVDFRAQTPNGVFSAPMLRLRDGRYPTVAGEIAMTDGAAADFHTRLGANVDFAGGTRRVVGIVENPKRLSDEFALGVDSDVAADFVAVLARGSFDPGRGGSKLTGGATFAVRVRGSDDRQLAATLVLLLSSVLLMLVALVATASFAVVAHRRQRQLGMLASVGASDRQLRLVMLSNGVAVGAVAAVLGAIVAFTAWMALQPRMEHALNRRLGFADIPWWVAGATTVLSLLAATAAAWWPARAVTRVPITEALSGRPPQPAAVHRSFVLAVLLLGAGSAAMAAGVDTRRDGSANGWLLLPGTCAVVIGVLVLSPLAIRAMSRGARRAPLPIRLALRDLDRYQARSGAALAAISLGLGIAVCTVVVATVAKQHFDEGNMPVNRLLFTTHDDFIAADIAAIHRSAIDAFAGTLGADTHVTELDVLQFQPPADTAKFDGGLPPMELTRRINAHSYRGLGVLYVATPDLLARLGLHPGPDVDVLTVEPTTKDLYVGVAVTRSPPQLKIQHYDGAAYDKGPTNLITEAGIAKIGANLGTTTRWVTGWMLEGGHALTKDEVRAARAAAADGGMVVTARNTQAGLLATRAIATAAGVVVALALLAMTIGLIRSEAGRDMQTLVATGATSFTRRALTASTSASLALLGSVLGIGGAYLGLSAIYLDNISDLDHPPLPELSVLLFGLPLIAAAAGWLLSGREPVAIVRHALD